MGPPGRQGPPGPPGPAGPAAKSDATPTKKTGTLARNGNGSSANGLQPPDDAADVEGKYPTAEERVSQWPVFRGALVGQAAGEFPTTWDVAKGKEVAWKMDTPLPGRNSPILWAGKVFFSGADEKRRGVYCVDAVTGKVVWKKQVLIDASKDLKAPDVMEETGFAAPTMACDGKRVFAIFANGDIAGFDLDGKDLWARNLGTPDNSYGHASSLATYRNLVIIQLDQSYDAAQGKSFLLALNVEDGKTVWKTPRPVPNSWSSPIVVNTGERDEIITAADPYVISYDAATGKELWRVDALSGDIGPSPTYAGGLIFACNDMGLAAIKAPTEDTEAKVVWTATDSLPDTTSPASDGQRVYVAASYGTVTCYRAEDGKKLWEQDLQASFSASPVIVGDKVYLSDTDGVTHIFANADKYKAISRGTTSARILATPAFVDGSIFIRTEDSLMRIGKGLQSEPKPQ